MLENTSPTPSIPPLVIPSYVIFLLVVVVVVVRCAPPPSASNITPREGILYRATYE